MVASKALGPLWSSSIERSNLATRVQLKLQQRCQTHEYSSIIDRPRFHIYTLSYHFSIFAVIAGFRAIFRCVDWNSHSQDLAYLEMFGRRGNGLSPYLWNLRLCACQLLVSSLRVIRFSQPRSWNICFNARLFPQVCSQLANLLVVDIGVRPLHSDFRSSIYAKVIRRRVISLFSRLCLAGLVLGLG